MSDRITADDCLNVALQAANRLWLSEDFDTLPQDVREVVGAVMNLDLIVRGGADLPLRWNRG